VRTLNTRRAARGFTLLSVMLAMALVGVIAFMLNRDSGFTVRRAGQQGDIERARYLAEAGLQAVNSAVQAAGCGGLYPTSATPLANSSFAGGSYSAYSSSLSGPAVTLVATGRYNGAQVTLTRANVPVYQPPKTLVLQPGSGQDTYVSPSSPDRNFGGDNRMRLFTGNYQPLLKFDLSTFPAGSRVVPWFDGTSGTLKPGATLSLYQSQHSGVSNATAINAQLITRSWIAGTGTGGGIGTSDGATWRTYDSVNAWPAPGVGYAPTAVASTPCRSSNGWVDWDVTTSVAAWLSGVYPNYGWWLIESGGDLGDTQYVSSEDSSASQRPKLTLNYLQPCGIIMSATLPAVADVYLYAGGTNASRNYGIATVLDTAYPKGPSPERRILLRFSMGSIPGGVTLLSGTLRLYCSSVSAASNNPKGLNAYFVLTSWVEGTMWGGTPANGATWNTRDGISSWSQAGGGIGSDYYSSWIVPGKDEATGITPLPGGFRQGWVTFDIRDAVQYWLDNVTDPNANNGIVIVFGTSVGDVLHFDSRESTGGRAPRLVVTY
jgi:type II secretory pathway pseudopilin PulG